MQKKAFTFSSFKQNIFTSKIKPNFLVNFNYSPVKLTNLSLSLSVNLSFNLFFHLSMKLPFIVSFNLLFHIF